MIDSARWRRPYPRYFGLTSVLWEEVETHHSSFLNDLWSGVVAIHTVVVEKVFRHPINFF